MGDSLIEFLFANFTYKVTTFQPSAVYTQITSVTLTYLSSFDSCCGKYVKGSGRAIGACSFEEYSQRPGCGDKLVKAFRNYLKETDPFIVFQKVRLVIVIIYEIVQAVAIGLSFYVYMARKDRYHGTGSQVFYKANG